MGISSRSHLLSRQRTVALLKRSLLKKEYNCLNILPAETSAIQSKSEAPNVSWRDRKFPATHAL